MLDKKRNTGKWRMEDSVKIFQADFEYFDRNEHLL
jgi:hypothetical protein